jgi:hypothetical protein
VRAGASAPRDESKAEEHPPAPGEPVYAGTAR